MCRYRLWCERNHLNVKIEKYYRLKIVPTEKKTMWYIGSIYISTINIKNEYKGVEVAALSIPATKEKSINANNVLNSKAIKT